MSRINSNSLETGEFRQHFERKTSVSGSFGWRRNDQLMCEFAERWSRQVYGVLRLPSCQLSRFAVWEGKRCDVAVPTHVNDRRRNGNIAKRETRCETRRRRQRSRFGLKRNAGHLPDTVPHTRVDGWRNLAVSASSCRCSREDHDVLNPNTLSRCQNDREHEGITIRFYARAVLATSTDRSYIEVNTARRGILRFRYCARYWNVRTDRVRVEDFKRSCLRA